MISMLHSAFSLGSPGSLSELDGVADGGERVAQLVGEHGQELVLAAVGLRQLGEPSPELLLQPLPLGDVADDAR